MLRLRDWFARLKAQRTKKGVQGALREFVYLDDVSVHSILASRTGGIATQFTENQGASTTNEAGRSMGIGIGATKVTANTKSRRVEAKNSEVLSKAVIQTSFKELYELERDSLAMRVLDKDAEPESVLVHDFKQILEQSQKKGPWLLDAKNLCRGNLIEVELALEADPIFHMVSVFATVMDLFEHNEHLLGYDAASQLPQVASLVRVLEGLLAGLVPVRGRLVEYKSAKIGDQDILIHQKLVDQLTVDDLPALRPAYVVGVAERNLFWKDIRRVLFSGAEYTAFCRVATTGLARTWHPVKVANVLGGIVPNFDELMVNLTEMARKAIAESGTAARTNLDRDQQLGISTMLAYAESISSHHGKPLTAQMKDEITRVIPNTTDWLNSVTDRKPIFAKVTQIVEGALGAEERVDGEMRIQFRRAALSAAGFATPLLSIANGVGQHEEALTVDRDVVFLDTEIVAIYW